MTTASVHAFPGFEEDATALADALRIPVRCIDIHTFPDGESRVRVVPGPGTAIIFASLDHPDSKLIALFLAAEALRENGATRVVLVCPYLCYMRQDKAFNVGEAVSQSTIGALMVRYFDRVITVDPHLHRVASLAEVMPGIRADALSAAALIGDMIAANAALEGAMLIGPDSESCQWVSVAAKRANRPFLVAEKIRHGDRDVEISLPGAGDVHDRPAVIIDDLISSGGTICRCAELLAGAGATQIEAIAVHVLADSTALAAMTAAGVSRVRSSNSIKHPSNAFSLTPLFVGALEEEVDHEH